MKILLLIVGALMTLGGLVWAMQGLGYLGGSPMTGETTWAIVGPIVAGFGVALLYVALRGSSGGTDR
jgi:asparagine N-glycosylation enzyme membrane subunit Stt3